MSELWGGIEAGGTKFICALTDPHGELIQTLTVPTHTPKETLPQLISFFESAQHQGHLTRIGIGCFGPLDLQPHSETYGMITSSPKQAWQGTNILSTLQAHFNIPIAIHTDVNAAALGEYHWGTGQGYKHLLYVTVGTGIGVGAIINDHIHQGLLHAEMGHMLIPIHPLDLAFSGACPYHGNCWEGLASGPAISARYGQPTHTLSPEHPIWPRIIGYIGDGLVNLILSFTPECIILGGGVLQQPHLLPQIRQHVKKRLNHYLNHPKLNHMEDYLVTPTLGTYAGVLGAALLPSCLSYS